MTPGMASHIASPTLRNLAAPDSALAPLALVGSMTSVCLGASFARALFPALGAAGTVTLRIALAALLLVALHRAVAPTRCRDATRRASRSTASSSG